MKNYVQPGNMITVAAPAAVSSGGGVQIGSLFGIAAFDAASGASLEIATEGVFDMAKPAAEAVAVGDDLYWDDTAKEVTNVQATNLLIGVAIAAAAGSDASVRVRLH